MTAPALIAKQQRNAGLRSIVERTSSFEQLASGFEFVEGPVWLPSQEALVFSDIIGNTMYRWSERDGVQILRKPSNMANGSCRDHQDRLLICEHAASRVSRLDCNGGYEVLVSSYQGLELNSPNDIVVNRQGKILFTDPNSGRGPRYGVERKQQLGFQGVFRFDPTSGELTLLADDFSKPNGLCLSHAESRLFVNDTDRQHIRVFDVLDDGSLGNGQTWASVDGEQPGVADGMKLDCEGNLYCCGSGGIHIFNPGANLLGVIPAPEVAANFTWGGRDLTDLPVTATHSIYRLRVKIPGHDPIGSQQDMSA